MINSLKYTMNCSQMPFNPKEKRMTNKLNYLRRECKLSEQGGGWSDEDERWINSPANILMAMPRQSHTINRKSKCI